MRNLAFRMAVLLAAILVLVTSVFGQTYTAYFFGDLGGNQTTMNAVNNDRVVVGTSRNASNQWRPVKWDSGTLTDLGALTGVQSTDHGNATDVNNSGQIVGYWSVNGNYVPFYVSAAGTMISILPSGWSYAFANAINDNGIVLGHGSPGSGVRIFLYDTNTGTHTILSSSYTTGGQEFSDAVMIGLGDGDILDYNASTVFNIKPTSQGTMYVRGVSSLGMVVGEWYNYNTNMWGYDRAWLWRPLEPNGHIGRIEMIPGLTANSNNYAADVNCWGWVVGIDSTGYGFLYKGCSTLNLNTLKPASVTATVINGKAINDAGDIVVETNASGTNRHVLFVQN